MTAADCRFLAEAVLLEHREWVDSHPAATLGELRARIEAAIRQCRRYILAGDPVIADRAGVPSPLADELALWPPAGGECGGPERFSDAGARLAGYAWRIGLLAELLGDGFAVEGLAEAIL